MRKTHPVLVVEYDRVCRDEVEAQSPRTGAQKEQARGVRAFTAVLETVDLLLPVGHGRGSIYARYWPALELSGPVLHTVSVVKLMPWFG